MIMNELNNAVIIDEDKLKAYTAKGCPLCIELITEAKRISAGMNPDTIKQGFKYYFMNEDLTPALLKHLRMAGHRNFPHLCITSITISGIPLKGVVIIEYKKEKDKSKKT